MQNSNDIQEPVVSQNRIAQLGISNRATTKSRKPSREATSLRTKLQEFEEMCHYALEAKTMDALRECYKAILKQARSGKDGIAGQRSLSQSQGRTHNYEVGTDGGKTSSLDYENENESEELDRALLKARTLFNDTSDLMKVNALKAFEEYHVPYLPKSHQSKQLRLITSQFLSHASALNGSKVKLLLEGWHSDGFKRLSGAEAKKFISQSHFTFQNSLQKLDGDLDRTSGDQESTKSLRKGLRDLSDLGRDVLKATLICLQDKETFQMAYMFDTTSIQMLESKYDDMKKIYEQARNDESLMGR